MVDDIKNKRTVYFSTSAQLAKRLGGESVSDPIIAVLELIKNSYDADATYCRITFKDMRSEEEGTIIIEDDGEGMVEEDIIHKWLRVATDNKTVNKYTKKYKRRKIGEKGIGRFATERLAKKIILTSNPEKETEGYSLEIDWSKYDDPNADFDKIPLELNFFKKQKTKKGFRIILEDLKEGWDEEKFKKLRNDISLIIPPTVRNSKFSVEIKAEEFRKVEGEVKSSFLKNADIIFSGKLEKNGNIKYTIRKGSKILVKEDKLKQFLCGPIEFKLFFFYLGPTEALTKKDNQNIDFSLRRKMMDQFCGIKLYRDCFRVKPFGDPKNDWLELNKERINNPGLYPGTKQIFGIVKISKDNNPNISDTTSRENIVTNLAWSDLKNFIKGSLRYFSLERQKLEKKYKGAKKKKREKNLIKESFKKVKEEAVLETPIEESKISTISSEIIDSSPKNIASLLKEFNGCLINGYFNAAAILARKILEVGTILKFKRTKKGHLIIENGEYKELNQRIDILKKEKLIDAPLAKRLINDNKIKIFGDSAAHSFRIDVKEEDIGPIRDLLRLCIEQLNSDD